MHEAALVLRQIEVRGSGEQSRLGEVSEAAAVETGLGERHLAQSREALQGWEVGGEPTRLERERSQAGTEGLHQPSERVGLELAAAPGEPLQLLQSAPAVQAVGHAIRGS